MHWNTDTFVCCSLTWRGSIVKITGVDPAHRRLARRCQLMKTSSMKPSVSIIDDDEDVLLAVSSLIRALGWQVRLFSSAGEFLRSDAIRDTGCIVCDIHMPDMSGIEMQDVLR